MILLTTPAIKRLLAALLGTTWPLSHAWQRPEWRRRHQAAHLDTTSAPGSLPTLRFPWSDSNWRPPY
jgi:hypothetical protein